MLTTTNSFQIRWMVRRDMNEVLAIEAASFEFPWKEREFIETLRQRDCIAMSAEREQRIVGYMVYNLLPQSLELLNFAIVPEFRRMGIGRAMINKLVTKLTCDRRNRILCKVRETNIDAQLFFKAMGFRAISLLRDHYEETHEDAYLFQLRKPCLYQS